MTESPSASATPERSGTARILVNLPEFCFFKDAPGGGVDDPAVSIDRSSYVSGRDLDAVADDAAIFVYAKPVLQQEANHPALRR